MAEDRSTATMVTTMTSKLLTDPGLLAAFSHELNSMVGKSSGYIESLPKCVKRRIKALKNLQVEFFKLESAFYSEVHELECKYAKLYGPLYKKRENIINAVLEPTDSDCDWDSDEDDVDEETCSKQTDYPAKVDGAENSDQQNDESAKGIPEFWFTVLKNVNEFSDLIKEHDEEILKSLQDIRINYRSQPDMEFQVEFEFAPNNYFSNTVLTKNFVLRCLPDPEKPLRYDGPEIIRSEGCVINWKPGKNITSKKRKEKQTGNKSAKKFVTKTVRQDSFFNFFSSTSSESKDECEDNEDCSPLVADFELGQMLQERIVPRAVLYFTGDVSDDDSENEDDDANDDDNKEIENNSDEDDPDYVPPKNMKDGPPDCSQQ